MLQKTFRHMTYKINSHQKLTGASIDPQFANMKPIRTMDETFNSVPDLLPCLRRRSSEERPLCLLFSPSIGHGLLEGSLKSVSA